MTSALFSVLFISVAVTKLPCWGHSDSDYSGKSGREHMKGKREVYQKTEWHRGKERERNTKHYFWQPLQASPSVTLITIQLWEKGYSIQHSGAQPGSCSSVGQARAPPLSHVCAFGCLCSLTYASVPLKNFSSNFTAMRIYSFHYVQIKVRRMTTVLVPVQLYYLFKCFSHFSYLIAKQLLSSARPSPCDYISSILGICRLCHKLMLTVVFEFNSALLQHCFKQP